ncbi:hypothetical protein TWF694_011249 [Orbilia ellipsospora]|uniref:Uncharacterized protein n=1 Tax=Orbilia ellipsospora TaxID=2528407 RepID=A0AAV9X9H4_9PEZI
MPLPNYYRNDTIRHKIIQRPLITNEEYACLRLAVMNYQDNVFHCQQLVAKRDPGKHIMTVDEFRIAVHATMYNIGDGLRQFAERDNTCHEITYSLAPSGWAVFFAAMENDDKMKHLDRVVKTIDASVRTIEEFLDEQDELIDNQQRLAFENSFHRSFGEQNWDNANMRILLGLEDDPMDRKHRRYRT